jgi:uncharacterized protein DUF6328
MGAVTPQLATKGTPMSDERAVDRNWNELLQELRVTQTGLQILTGFLVTLPFQQRFSGLGSRQVLLYLVTLEVAIVATVLVLAPASLHRLLFRQQERSGWCWPAIPVPVGGSACLPRR